MLSPSFLHNLVQKFGCVQACEYSRSARYACEAIPSEFFMSRATSRVWVRKLFLQSLDIVIFFKNNTARKT